MRWTSPQVFSSPACETTYTHRERERESHSLPACCSPSLPLLMVPSVGCDPALHAPGCYNVCVRPVNFWPDKRSSAPHCPPFSFPVLLLLFLLPLAVDSSFLVAVPDQWIACLCCRSAALLRSGNFCPQTSAPLFFPVRVRVRRGHRQGVWNEGRECNG